ncbi:MAG: hypothetical protein IID45_05235, partial [Planctomycetes bacterium]|nr:hypothetical protein [Planctomycetota bacterium]
MNSWLDGDVVHAIVLSGLPLLPLAAFLLIVATGRRWSDRRCRLIAAGIALISAIAAVALLAVIEFAGSSHSPFVWYEWIHIPGNPPLTASLSVSADSLSLGVLAVLSIGVVFVVRGIGRDEPAAAARAHCARAMLLLFSVSMLVLSTNWLTMFLFWQLAGVACLLPSGRIAEHPQDAAAARKIFLFGLAADAFLLAGILLVAVAYGSLDFSASLSAGAEKMTTAANEVSGSLIAWCLFIGVAGRCLLVPFLGLAGDLAHDREPSAALLHAGILIPTGGYLIIRTAPLFLASPDTLEWMFWSGAVTL